MNPALIELIILAGIAVFLFLRLRSVLGTREGFEKPRMQTKNDAPKRDFKVIDGGEDKDITDNVEKNSKSAKALKNIKEGNTERGTFMCETCTGPEDGENNLRVFQSRSGHRLTFDDTNGAEKVSLILHNQEIKVIWDSANKQLSVYCGKDIIIEVPLGTIVKSVENENNPRRNKDNMPHAQDEPRKSKQTKKMKSCSIKLKMKIGLVLKKLKKIL